MKKSLLHLVVEVSAVVAYLASALAILKLVQQMLRILQGAEFRKLYRGVMRAARGFAREVTRVATLPTDYPRARAVLEFMYMLTGYCSATISLLYFVVTSGLTVTHSELPTLNVFGGFGLAALFLVAVKICFAEAERQRIELFS